MTRASIACSPYTSTLAKRSALHKSTARLFVEMLAKVLWREIGQRPKPDNSAENALGADISRGLFQPRTRSRTIPVSCMRYRLLSVLQKVADSGGHTTRHFACGSHHCARHWRTGIETMALNRVDNNVLRCAPKDATKADRVNETECMADVSDAFGPSTSVARSIR